MVGEDDARCLADQLGKAYTGVDVVDGPAVFVDERDLTVEDAGVLVADVRCDAEIAEQGRVVGVAMDDHLRVGSHAMQFGVDVHRAGHVPRSLEHLAVGGDEHDVGRTCLVPPDSPRIAPEFVDVVAGPSDVARDVLLPAVVGENAQRTRKLLSNAQWRGQRGVQSLRPRGASPLVARTSLHPPGLSQGPVTRRLASVDAPWTSSRPGAAPP